MKPLLRGSPNKLRVEIIWPVFQDVLSSLVSFLKKSWVMVLFFYILCEANLTFPHYTCVALTILPCHRLFSYYFYLAIRVLQSCWSCWTSTWWAAPSPRGTTSTMCSSDLDKTEERERRRGRGEHKFDYTPNIHIQARVEREKAACFLGHGGVIIIIFVIWERVCSTVGRSNFSFLY